MSTLVLVDVESEGSAKGRIRQSSRSALTCAAHFGPVDVIVFGPEGAEQAARLPGVRKVLHVPALSPLLAERAGDFLATIAGEYSHILAANSSTGKNILPRLAGLLDVQPISDVIAVKDAETFIRPVYAGNLLATVRSHDTQKLLTIRGSSFDPAAEEGGSAEIEVKDLPAPGPACDKVDFVKIDHSSSDRPDLETARVVISGGRGLKDSANFEIMLAPLAKILGAAIGASRSAVDAGFAPNEMQVGQTGKVVAPDLYIAVGLSGALQHLAGMKDSRVIVAINIDPDAPIFKVADYGLVGDLFEILPQLEKSL